MSPLDIYDEAGVWVTPDEAQHVDRITTLGAATTRYNTLNLAKRVLDQGVPGDMAEVGVLSGGHPAIMAYALSTYGAGGGRKVHLYDSFQGHPMAGPEDNAECREKLGVNPDVSHAIPTPHREYACAGYRWQVEQNMVRWGVDRTLLVYHEGFTQDLLPREAADGSLPLLALLRVDVDLWVSTLPVVKYLYPMVVPGGYVICDDWGEGAATPARRAWLDGFIRLGIQEPSWRRLPVDKGTVWWRK